MDFVPLMNYTIIKLGWCYFQPLPYSQGVTTARSSGCLICWHLYTGYTGYEPDATPKGLVSPLRIELRIFHLLGKWVNHYTLKLG